MNMSCNHPLKAFWTGNFTDKGRKEFVICPSTSGDVLNVVYAERKGFHIGVNAPLVELNGHSFLKDPIPLPCGHCIGCRMSQAREWKVRLCLEALDYPDDQVHFVTLTYDDAHLPIDENGQPFLVKSHISEFIHSMRGRFTQHRHLRFFACGEYGENTHRPHYHLILFGDIGELIPYEFGSYHSARIYESWPLGLHDVKVADPGCMSYVAGYMEKKQKDPLYKTYTVKPFRKMSTHPGIGFSVLDSIGYPDVQVYGNFGNIHNTSAPKSFLKKLEDKPWFDDFKAMMEEKAKAAGFTMTNVTGMSDEDLRGFLLDDAAENHLKNVRKEKL